MEFYPKLERLIEKKDRILKENNLRVVGQDQWVRQKESTDSERYIGMFDVYTTNW
ncbi:MAG: hypothetical protein R3B41_04300 [Candidatus Doudnabacteria bacterium]